MSKSLKETLGPLKIGGLYSNFKLYREIEKRSDAEMSTGRAQKLAHLKALRRLIEVLSNQLK